ncbi:MAG: (2Fe-2S)-binding protein [Rhodocyclaceae bacterium]|jgi:carbon-monoxide dehydrogenase small subunit|nr:(2Fe-2S)-binding protein [Rhodocyclaceae bacterium]MCE2978929.1 (2Fe-2S)-binding protein [Betaproteobacteria bacterium]MCA3073035.1 (2Fe-2S)-binding protein [Rhodocyclaceae bacterium]MCA3088689.1 (2Fe-2S)-binding protein [Rhodocyclaceae bacterium]MCA3092527.1 (2Fe-2S)-binding protein [Rhodocyclaceae bacterium]
MNFARTLAFTLNGRALSGADGSIASPSMRLLDLLRLQAGQTGTKEGCGEGECGACAVLVDGEVVNSCLVPVGQLHGRTVTSIEGLPRTDPLLEAFARAGATQCGICTPGMILAARALLDRQPDPSLDEVREALAGNLCRCTGYARIYAAVLDAATVRGGDA